MPSRAHPCPRPAHPSIIEEASTIRGEAHSGGWLGRGLETERTSVTAPAPDPTDLADWATLGVTSNAGPGRRRRPWLVGLSPINHMRVRPATSGGNLTAAALGARYRRVFAWSATRTRWRPSILQPSTGGSLAGPGCAGHHSRPTDAGTGLRSARGNLSRLCSTRGLWRQAACKRGPTARKRRSWVYPNSRNESVHRRRPAGRKSTTG